MRGITLLGTLILSGFVVLTVPAVVLAHDGEEHPGETGGNHDALHDRLEHQHDNAHQHLREQHAAFHERLENSNLSPEQKRRMHNALHDRLENAHDSLHQKLRRQHAAAHNNPPRPTPAAERPAAPARPAPAVRPTPVARPAPAPVRRSPAAPVQTRGR